MSTYLITGGRAPVTFDIAKNLKQYGHRVYVVDVWSHTISHYVDIDGYYQVPSPRFALDAFKQKLIDILIKEKIDFIIPTCEETFYVAQIKDALNKHCQVLCDDFAKLNLFHSKWNILAAAQDCGVLLPKTSYLNSDLEITNLDHFVIKQEYSRFGDRVYCNLTEKLVNKLQCDTSHNRYLLQEKIQGHEYCNYAYAQNGHLVAHVVYEPKYRLAHSASMYFEPTHDAVIEEFMINFVKKHNFSGQIGFDFIKNNAGVYLIECNPRCNNGVHLLTQWDLSRIFAGESMTDDIDMQPKMLAYAMLISALPQSILRLSFKSWLNDYQRAVNVLYLESFSKRALRLRILFKLLLNVLKYRSGMRDVMTRDIAWNGYTDV